jgi:DNA-binding NarL/FixJ family response regulator
MELMPTDSFDVLIAEDHELWREFIRSTLQQHSETLSLHVVTDGPDAIRHASELQPGLIVLDVGLPTLSGIEAARQIRRLSPRSKILFVSQEASPALVREALGIGHGYVAKMDAGRELLTAVAAILRGDQFVGDRFAKHDFARKERPATRQEHVVYFYPDDDHLLNCLAELFRKALGAGDSIIAVTTREHRLSLMERLTTQGIDVSDAIEKGRITLCDASEELSRFMDVDGPNKKRLQFQFEDMVRKKAASSATQTNRVVLFGEMVAVLWAQKNYDAAIRLEQLWNELTQIHPFYLCCAYPAQEFAENSDGHRAAICAEHSCEVSAF